MSQIFQCDRCMRTTADPETAGWVKPEIGMSAGWFDLCHMCLEDFEKWKTPKEPKRRRRRTMTPEFIESVAEMHRHGMNGADIARRFGVSRPQGYKYLQEARSQGLLAESYAVTPPDED